MTSTRTLAPTRRRGTALAAAAALSLVLAACSGGTSDGGGGGGGEEESGSWTAPDADLEASITYGVWDANQVPAIEENIAAFNEEYPNIEVNVNVTPFGEYWTKLQTQASSDTLPDLFWMNGPNFQLYAANGQLDPITEVVEAGAIDPANYPASLNDLYTLDDVQYGVPKDFDTIGVWTNTVLFEQAGVPLPEADWTWEDFQSAAVAISQALSAEGIYGAAGGMDGQTTYYNTILQAGGTVIDGAESAYDTPEAAAGIGFWTELIESGGSPTIEQLTDTTADQWFTSGKLAMYWGGSWFRGALTDSPFVDDIQVLPLPQGEEQAVVIHGVSNVVPAASANKQAAHALQAFLADEEAQRQQGDLGAVIPAFAGTQDAFAESMPNANLQVFLDAVEYSQPLPVSGNTAAWNALEADLLPQAFSGERPVEDVLAELAEGMDAALAEE